VNSTDKEMDSNQRFVKQSISLKLINGGPNKVRGFEKIEKLINGGVYLAPESTKRQCRDNRLSASFSK